MAVLAGCGGGGGASVKSSDVATVGGVHVEKTDYDALIAQAQRSYAQQGRKFPKQGTSDYETVKGQAVTLLVQQAEREEKAKSMGIDVSDADVQKRLEQIKKQYFGGSEKKYQAQLKKQKLSDEQVRKDIRAQLISEAVFNKVTKDVTVSNDDVHAYYVAHPQLYSQPQTRDVQYILVKKKALAQTIYGQLKSGNDKTWCTLAKKYSQDPSSK
ncbi:MAG: SurA N-terminal domain-containing protein, partial [Gaiellaceae bacterium]